MKMIKKKISISTVITDLISLALLLVGVSSSIYLCILSRRFNWFVVIIMLIDLLAISIIEMCNDNYKIKNRYWKDSPVQYSKYKKIKINSGAYKIKKRFLI